jgi:hypothetical protein
MKIFIRFLAVTAIAVLLTAGVSAVLAQGQSQPMKLSQHSIHDANSDGICDICGKPVGSGRADAQGRQAKQGKHWGPADGTGNQGVGPRDGTGYGSQSGKGVRDGTGPYHPRGGAGAGRRGGR